MKLSDYKNEDALDLLADIIEPTAKILTDKKIQAVFTGKKFNKMQVVKTLLKDHQHSIVEIMAALDGKTYDEYEFNIITGTKQLLELLNDEALISFFQSQGQMMVAESSGSATASTEGTEEN